MTIKMQEGGVRGEGGGGRRWGIRNEETAPVLLKTAEKQKKNKMKKNSRSDYSDMIFYLFKQLKL